MKRKSILYSIIICALAIIISCSGTSTEEYLDGDFIDSLGEDTTAPNILTPRSGEKVLVVNPTNLDPMPVTLQWTAKNNASNYTVEIATDELFENQIEDSPFTVEDVFLEITPTDSRRYYWRVRADITATGSYGSAYFDTMDDTVYVYCPESDASCSDSGMTGNKDNPYRTIAAGLDEADRLGLKNVKVAARSTTSDVAYFETISIVNGIDLTGGYAPPDPTDPDAAFSETDRDITVNRTVITGEGMNTVFANGIFQETNVDGFVINGPHEYKGTFSLYIVTSSNKLTITNCEITGGDSDTFYSIGAAIIDSFVTLENNTITGGKGLMSGGAVFQGYGCPEIRNNTFAGADLGEVGNECDNCETTGIMMEWGFPTIENNIIRGGNVVGDDGRSNGITMDESAEPVMRNNIIIAGNVDGYDGRSTAIKCQTRSRPTLTNNIIVSGDTDTSLPGADGDSESAETYGIRLEGDTNPAITNNTIRSGSGYYSYAIHAEGDDSSGSNTEPYVNYNIIFTVNGAVYNYGFYEANNNFSNPNEFNYNLIFDASDGLYADFISSGPDTWDYIIDVGSDGILNNLPDNELDTVAQCGDTTCSNNNISTSGSIGSVFVDTYDANDPATWIIEISGPADLNGGGWSGTETDIGADAASAGPQ